MNLPSKEKILDRCMALLIERIAFAQSAMCAAQEAANNEEKSSAGDKYETSKAMGQLARDMNAKQLAIAQKELSELQLLTISTASQKVGIGSLVVCNERVFFIAVGLGTILVEGKSIAAVSIHAPLSKLMIGKKSGDAFLFNDKTFLIKQIV